MQKAEYGKIITFNPETKTGTIMVGAGDIVSFDFRNQMYAEPVHETTNEDYCSRYDGPKWLLPIALPFFGNRIPKEEDRVIFHRNETELKSARAWDFADSLRGRIPLSARY